MVDYYIKSIKGFGSKRDNKHLYPIVAWDTTEANIRKEALKLIKAHPKSEFIIYARETQKNGKNRFMDQFWVHWDKESDKPVVEFYLHEWKPGYTYNMDKPKSKSIKSKNGISFDPYMYLMTDGRVGYNEYKAKRK